MAEKKAEHTQLPTPLPWELRRHEVLEAFAGKQIEFWIEPAGASIRVPSGAYAITLQMAEANAAYIVKSANYHDRLVGMVQKLKFKLEVADQRILNLRARVPAHELRDPCQLKDDNAAFAGTLAEAESLLAEMEGQK